MRRCTARSGGAPGRTSHNAGRSIDCRRLTRQVRHFFAGIELHTGINCDDAIWSGLYFGSPHEGFWRSVGCRIGLMACL
jgi:hypothetical protein